MARMAFKEKTIVNAETLNLTYGTGVISSLTVISCVKLTLSPCISHLSRAEIQPSASWGTRRGPHRHGGGCQGHSELGQGDVMSVTP